MNGHAQRSLATFLAPPPPVIGFYLVGAKTDKSRAVAESPATFLNPTCRGSAKNSLYTCAHPMCARHDHRDPSGLFPEPRVLKNPESRTLWSMNLIVLESQKNLKLIRS